MTVENKEKINYTISQLLGLREDFKIMVGEVLSHLKTFPSLSDISGKKTFVVDGQVFNFIYNNFLPQTRKDGIVATIVTFIHGRAFGFNIEKQDWDVGIDKKLEGPVFDELVDKFIAAIAIQMAGQFYDRGLVDRVHGYFDNHEFAEINELLDSKIHVYCNQFRWEVDARDGGPDSMTILGDTHIDRSSPNLKLNQEVCKRYLDKTIVTMLASQLIMKDTWSEFLS